jgi:riboflavin biosynthesis pyrimidine reductase
MQPLRDGAGKVFIHFTMSLDGFIADAEGRVDWALRPLRSTRQPQQPQQSQQPQE